MKESFNDQVREALEDVIGNKLDVKSLSEQDILNLSQFVGDYLDAVMSKYGEVAERLKDGTWEQWYLDLLDAESTVKRYMNNVTRLKD